MNKVIISNARLTRDVEIRYSNDGKAFAKFGIAVNREFKREEADFINCIAFGKTAETISSYFTKGSAINFEGRIQTSAYNDKDGNRRTSFDVVIDRFEFPVGGKAHNNNDNNNKGDSNTGNWELKGFTEDDGDIPF